MAQAKGANTWMNPGESQVCPNRKIAWIHPQTFHCWRRGASARLPWRNSFTLLPQLNCSLRPAPFHFIDCRVHCHWCHTTVTKLRPRWLPLIAINCHQSPQSSTAFVVLCSVAHHSDTNTGRLVAGIGKLLEFGGWYIQLVFLYYKICWELFFEDFEDNLFFWKNPQELLPQKGGWV